MSESAFSNRIVQSLLDTDFYKLTMMQAVLHNYPNVDVEWEFRCRNGEDLRPYLDEIKHQIELLCELSLSPEHLAFLERITFIKPDFLRFLGLFRFNTRYVKTTIENDELCIRLHGPWLHVILFEVPLLAIVSEVRNRHRYPDTLLSQARDRLYDKFEWLTTHATTDELAELKVADFGTRRRFSYRVQEEMLGVLKNDFPGQFVGTSNVHLARQLDLKPLGTMAHEWIMAHQQLGPRLIDSQIAALDCWVREYRGLLGIALTDCITTDAFLNDFDLYFAKLFDGLRHDSGDPVKWAEKMHLALPEARYRPDEQDPGVFRWAEPAQGARYLSRVARTHQCQLRDRHQPDGRHPRHCADEHGIENDGVRRSGRGEDL
ncbi:Nicotinate phosphoribosyltransferase [Pseudomonas syringae pv. aceris]|nr:Nicotinate phosphoribosyltransferase [Pseudomonas syringae pv. aceris]